VASLSAIGKGVRLQPATLVFHDLTRKEAEKLFSSLVEAEVMTSLGLVLAGAASFDPATFFHRKPGVLRIIFDSCHRSISPGTTKRT
jgi:hypothetical protein